MCVKTMYVSDESSVESDQTELTGDCCMVPFPIYAGFQSFHRMLPKIDFSISYGR